MTIHTYQAVVEYVCSSDEHTKNALRWLLSMQTNEELIIRDSLHDNGAGFRAKYQTRDDAGTAKRLLLAGGWDEKDRRVAKTLCWTYRRQLTARANGCKSRSEVGQFKLRAIHDRDSRAYARYIHNQKVQAAPVQTPDPTVADLTAAVARLAEAVAHLQNTTTKKAA
jgi:hypothetical protein